MSTQVYQVTRAVIHGKWPGEELQGEQDKPVACNLEELHGKVTALLQSQSQIESLTGGRLTIEIQDHPCSLGKTCCFLSVIGCIWLYCYSHDVTCCNTTFQAKITKDNTEYKVAGSQHLIQAIANKVAPHYSALTDIYVENRSIVINFSEKIEVL